MLLDANFSKYYVFVIMFDTYSCHLRTYLEAFQNKKSQIFREDVMRFFKNSIITINYLLNKSIMTLNPVCLEAFVVCSDS